MEATKVKKRLVFPDVMTAKQIANILHRVKRMKWGTGKLKRGDHYCALGMLARLGGVSKAVLSDKTTLGGPKAVWSVNDASSTKESVARALCEKGDEPIPVGSWIRDILKKSGK
jgi:hypothetical protein